MSGRRHANWQVLDARDRVNELRRMMEEMADDLEAINQQQEQVLPWLPAHSELLSVQHAVHPAHAQRSMTGASRAGRHRPPGCSH